MRFLFVTVVSFIFSTSLFAQKKLDKTLRQLNKESVPYAYVDELNTLENVTILDTREKAEYEVSHIKESVWVGYENFDVENVLKRFPDKNKPILVYCSIGVRSEDVGEKLQKAGYTNVKNLYGGIFEWKNNDQEVYNQNQVATDSVHAFDQYWGKLLNKGIKVYNK